MMSGIDEQHSDECPKCQRIPPYWTLGNLITGGLVWLYTENYDAPHKRSRIVFTTFDGIKSVSEVESRIDYVWCSKCMNRFSDMTFIKSRIERAKKLEAKGRVGLP